MEMIFLRLHSTSLENGKIPVMRFDCSCIRGWLIKTSVFLKMQEFQNLPPHLYLDQIIDLVLGCLPPQLLYLFLLIESLVLQKIILECAPPHYFHLLVGCYHFREIYYSLYMMRFQLRLQEEYHLKLFRLLLKSQLNFRFLCLY